MGWKLVDVTDGHEIKEGESVKDFRGEQMVFAKAFPPHKPSSSGRVCVKIFDNYREYYPSVINAKFVEEASNADK